MHLGPKLRAQDYRFPGEKLSLTLTLLLLGGIYFLLLFYFALDTEQRIKALFVTFGVLAVYLISVILQQRAAFGSLVRVGEKQFGEIHDLAIKAATRLGSSPIPVYIKRSSEQNLYTLGIWRRRLIVIHSAMVDQMSPANLQFFIGREIGHIQTGHTSLRALLRPVGSEIPVIGKLLNSVLFGDWINRSEFTADRAGFIAAGSLTASIEALLKFSVGIKLFEKLEVKEFLQQIYEIGSWEGKVAEIATEQPFMTRRVRNLVRFGISSEFHRLIPEEHSRSQILGVLPERYLQTLLRNTTPAKLVTRNEKTKLDLHAATALAENDIDPEFFLLCTETHTRHPLRRWLTRLGRDPDNDLVISNERVSHFHAEISRENGIWQILDKKSLNGISLNGTKITNISPLRPGDRLRIGHNEFLFCKDQNERKT